MKTKILLTIVLVVVSIIGCKKEDSGPVNTITNGNGIISGRVLLILYGKLSYHLDHSDVMVSVLGTSIESRSNKDGNWVLRGLDSGSYTLRFIKLNFDTLYAYNVVSNGRDSVALGSIYTDTTINKPTLSLAGLMEITATPSITSAYATIVQGIHIPIDTPYFMIDTTYSWSATMTMDVTAPNARLKDSASPDYAAFISPESGATRADFPEHNLITTWSNNAKGVWGWDDMYDVGNFPKVLEINKKSKPINMDTYAKKQGFDLKGKQQLYLHILPFVKGLRRAGKNEKDKKDGLLPNEIVYAMIAGKPYSIPIVWK